MAAVPPRIDIPMASSSPVVAIADPLKVDDGVVEPPKPTTEVVQEAVRPVLVVPPSVEVPKPTTQKHVPHPPVPVPGWLQEKYDKTYALWRVAHRKGRGAALLKELTDMELEMRKYPGYSGNPHG